MRRLAAALVLAVAAESAAPQGTPVELDFAVRLDPASRELHGRGVIRVDVRGPTVLVLGARFEMLRLSIDGTPFSAQPNLREDRRSWRLPTASGPRRIEVEWRGTLAPLDGAASHRDTLARLEPVADPRGSFVPAAAAWYPEIEGVLASYRFALELPAGQKGLVPGRLVEESEHDGRYRASFDFPHPAEGIHLIAGPYRIESRDVQSWSGKLLKLRTYFHPEIAALGIGYLDAVQRYIDLYESWIDAYPFTEFSVVSSPTPTGFGMPTLTYLGIDVLRLPFIRATSLGHEVLHNWWGNGVYPDYARGDWSEGLTTFMADYTYKEREGEGSARTMRLQWLRDFAAVPPGADRPVAEFTARTHATSQIVGYNKAAMIFLMLRDRIGPEAFNDGLRRFSREHRFRVASWDDLRRAFQSAAGGDLAPFFAQWLARPGAPNVRIERAEASRPGEAHRVRLALAQDAPVWRVRVPVMVRTEQGERARVVDLSSERASLAIDLDAPPVSVTLDPDFRLFRRLGPEEAPPILRQVMVDPATTLIVASPGGALIESAGALAAQIADYTPRRHPAEAPPPLTPLLVVGLHEDVDAWLARFGLPARPVSIPNRGSAQVWTGALGAGRVLAVISARDADAIAALARPLPHYGRQSWLAFDGARMIDQGVWPARPQELPLR